MEDIFQTMFCDKDRCTQFQIDLFDRIQKVTGCDRIQLAGWLI